PVASTMAKSVSVLIEKPSRCTNANAPTSETGIVNVGISVARQLWRKKNITSTTSPIAIASVLSTSRIDSWTTVVVLNAIAYCRPGGNDFDSRWSSVMTAVLTSSALADGSAMTPKPTASRPWNRSTDPYVSAPSSTRP